MFMSFLFTRGLADFSRQTQVHVRPEYFAENLVAFFQYLHRDYGNIPSNAFLGV